MYDEVLQAVIDMASAAVGFQVLTGSMPPLNGIAMTGPSSPDRIYKDRGSNERMTVVCNGKNTSQEAVIRQLDAIHAALTRRFDFPSGEGWQIYSIETVSSPDRIGREANSQWLYRSTLLIKFYVKGKCL